MMVRDAVDRLRRLAGCGDPIPESVLSRDAAATERHQSGSVVDTIALFSDECHDASLRLEKSEFDVWDLVDDAVPVVALAVVGIRLGWAILQGEQIPFAQRRAFDQASLVIVTSAVAGIVSLITGTVLSRFIVVVSLGIIREVYWRLRAATVVARSISVRLDRMMASGPTRIDLAVSMC